MLNKRYKVNRYINSLIESGYIDVLEKGNYLESLNYNKPFIYKDCHTIYFNDKLNTKITIWDKTFTFHNNLGHSFKEFYNNKDLIEYADTIIKRELHKLKNEVL